MARFMGFLYVYAALVVADLAARFGAQYLGNAPPASPGYPSQWWVFMILAVVILALEFFFEFVKLDGDR